jgi:L-malate glycosyltransferase
MAPCRPNLAFVVNSLNPGGTERLVVNMGLALAHDFHVTVVCLDEPGLWASQLRKDGIPVYCVWRQPGLDLSTALKLARLFRQCRTDIIHAHQCTPWFYSALSRLFHEAPRLLLEEHGRFFPEVKNWKRAIVNRTLIRRLTHRFVAVSEDIRKRLHIYEGLDYQQIEVVYNGVNPAGELTKNTRENLRNQLGFGAAEFVVGTVGRFDPIKNLPLLVQGLAEVRNTLPGIRGLLIGDGPTFSETETLVERLGLIDSVVLTGFREDAKVLVQCMDLFVLPSFSEGTSMALLEAMAGGVPVAVTDVGGNPEIVEDDRNGWLIPSGDLESLAAVILKACRNPELASSYAAAGRLQFVQRFTFERMIESYRKTYQDLLNGSVSALPSLPQTHENNPDS